ncbi:MAG: hypothetical protein BWY74_00822 [Firmicutes bacterium ADurb.Bin419]|nr:MAG: hypothetical protein BWY74_00822 [Firmicutes bacterium ADurb.Bin419]
MLIIIITIIGGALLFYLGKLDERETQKYKDKYFKAQLEKTWEHEQELNELIKEREDNFWIENRLKYMLVGDTKSIIYPATDQTAGHIITVKKLEDKKLNK